MLGISIKETTKKKAKRVLAYIIIGITSIAGLFFLIVVPALVATEVMKFTAGSTLTAALLFILLWIAAAEFAYASLAEVFDLKRKYLLPIFNPENAIVFSEYLPVKRSRESTHIASAFYALTVLFFSFLFMVYGYGVMYTYISNVLEGSFNIGSLSLIEGLYFSVIVSSTVGFGDITPSSDFTRLLVISQIVISMAYVIVLFSTAVGYLKTNG